MGMSREEKALYAQLTQAIAAMQNPKSNPAQDYLTTESLAGAAFLKKGDFSQLPKGMFFDFQMPGEQNTMYKKYADVNQGGTFALANNQGQQGAKTGAQALQSKYLSDRFARDASQNYQNNISNAAQNIRGGLSAAAGAKSGTDATVISALGNLYSAMPKKKPFSWTDLIGPAAAIGAAAI